MHLIYKSLAVTSLSQYSQGHLGPRFLSRSPSSGSVGGWLGMKMLSWFELDASSDEQNAEQLGWQGASRVFVRLLSPVTGVQLDGHLHESYISRQFQSVYAASLEPDLNRHLCQGGRLFSKIEAFISGFILANSSFFHQFIIHFVPEC